MPTVLDSAGKPIDLPAEQVADKWRAGEVNLVAGQKYAVRSPLGKVFLVPAESLHTALGNGGHVISDADVADYKEQKEYGGLKGAAIAGASGFAEQATLGLAPNLYSESAKQAVEASTRQHPLVHGAGELGGALGLSAVLPGGGAAGLVERGGAALLEGAGESTLARISARALLHGAKAAAEGAQFGTAQAISDDAFADHKLTAAQMLSTIGANALWGGALGAGLGAAGAVLPRGAAGKFAEAGAAKTAVERAVEGGADDATIGNVAAKAIGADVDEAESATLGARARKFVAKLSSAVTGGDQADIEAVWAGRKELLEAKEVRAKAASDFRAHIDNLVEGSDLLEDEAKGPLKRGHIRNALEGVDPELGAQSARDSADRAITRLDEMLKNADDYGEAPYTKKTLKLVTKYSRELDAARASGDLAEQYGLVDDIKRAIGTQANKEQKIVERGAFSDALTKEQTRLRAVTLDELYHTIRNDLESSDVWGRAGEQQKAINAPYSASIKAGRDFYPAMTRRVEGPGFETLTKASSEKVDSYVKNLINPARDDTHQAVLNWVQNKKQLAETIGEYYQLPPDKAAQVRRVAQSANDFLDTINTTTKSLQLTNRFEKLREDTSGEASKWIQTAGAIAGSVVGGLPGGWIGAGLGKMADALTHPAEAIMKAARVEQMLRDSDLRIVKAFRGMTGGGAKAIPKATPVEAFSRKAGQVRALTTNPDLLQERIASNIGPMRRTAPKLSSALTMASLSGLAFLRDKLPPSAPPDPLEPTKKPREPSKGQQYQWLRYYDAVTDPGVLADQVRAGRVTPEAIEVLHLPAYKPLHDRMRQLAGEEFATGRMKDLTSQQRIGIALALDLPLPELSPEYISARQASFAPPPPPPQPGAPAGQPRKGKPVDFVKRAAPPQTPADRVELGAST